LFSAESYDSQAQIRFLKLLETVLCLSAVPLGAKRYASALGHGFKENKCMLIEGINPSIRIHGLNDILHVQAYRLWDEKEEQ